MRRGRAQFGFVEDYGDAELGKVVMLLPWGDTTPETEEPDPDVDRLERIRLLNAEEAKAFRRRSVPKRQVRRL
jgi:hypothetical protein